ncbi:MAG: hypothetical protein HGB12_00275 [Bacteroidetes bacterium]|nr:hypothetical protein [Bacteroidota bacterium]
MLDDRGFEIFSSQYVNTDSTNSYKGGRLSCGCYYGIVGYRTSGQRVIKLFSSKADITKIKTDRDIPDSMFALSSDIPNSNHDNAYYIEYVQIHSGGTSWDYSHGCVSVLNYGLNPNGKKYEEFDRLMSFLKDNEIIIIKLSLDEGVKTFTQQ